MTIHHHVLNYMSMLPIPVESLQHLPSVTACHCLRTFTPTLPVSSPSFSSCSCSSPVDVQVQVHDILVVHVNQGVYIGQLYRDARLLHPPRQSLLASLPISPSLISYSFPPSSMPATMSSGSGLGLLLPTSLPPPQPPPPPPPLLVTPAPTTAESKTPHACAFNAGSAQHTQSRPSTTAKCSSLFHLAADILRHPPTVRLVRHSIHYAPGDATTGWRSDKECRGKVIVDGTEVQCQRSHLVNVVSLLRPAAVMQVYREVMDLHIRIITASLSNPAICVPCRCFC